MCRKIEKKYEKLNIKSVYSLEKLKKQNLTKYKKEMNKKIHKILTCKTSEKLMKYMNRDINAVKNMLKIVSSYIKINIKPKIFVLGLPRKLFYNFLERLEFVYINKFKRRPKICNDV